MNTILRSALAVGGLAIATQAVAQITFYEREGFDGRSFTTNRQVGNLERYGFNDRASSAVVLRDRWEVCEDARFGGRCIILRPGRYSSLGAMGLNDRISSVRTVSSRARIDEDRYAPAPVVVSNYNRRDNERTYQANVTSVRAVVGPPEQRCWVEHRQVVQEQGSTNVPAAIAGTVIGGVLGHQVGGGRGQDVATAIGAVTGATIGANIGRNDNPQVLNQDIHRCENVGNQSRPAYWDVSYNFRNQEHRVQMTTPPGPTVTVNGQGEPRL